MALPETVDFLPLRWLETIASVLDTCERVAREELAPFNHLAELPQLDAWLAVVARREPLLRKVQEDRF